MSFLALLLSVAVVGAAPKGDPALVIRTPGKTVTWKRSQLIRRKDLVILELERDPSYPGQKRVYKAVPLAPLFEGVTVQKANDFKFECLDGFSAPIRPERLLNTDESKAVAYLAIEMPGETWPKVTGVAHGQSPAPYYLVWKNATASQISSEEWPYQLAGFVEQEPVAKKFPKIMPDSALSKNDPILNGHQVFMKTCFACHSLNKEGGETKIGPDLNTPLSPTEYLTDSGLRALIRNPQGLRWWPLSRMPGFDEKAISPRELDDLIAYLKHMSNRR